MARKDKSKKNKKGAKGEVRDDGGKDSTSAPTSPTADANDDSQPTLSASTEVATESVAESAPPPPPPPPPPPSAPLQPTTPTFQGGPRVVRRRSTSGAPTRSDASTSAHGRSATDPSASTPNLLSTKASDVSTTPPHFDPTLIAQAAAKRSNTLNSTSGLDWLNRFEKTVGKAWDNGKDNKTATEDLNSNASSRPATPTTPGRRATSPPPLKPKPSSLQGQKKISHERSSSALLRTAVVQNASSAGNAGGQNGKPGALTRGYTVSHAAGARKRAEEQEEPQRRSSVSQIARSLESTLQFSAPPSPGSPPTLYKRSSVASTRSVRSARSILSVRNADTTSQEADNEEEDEEDERARADDRGDGKEEERISAPPSADLKAVIASLAERGIDTNTSKSTSPKKTTATKTPPPPPVSTSAPPTPPLSPSTSGTMELFTAPTSPALTPPTPAASPPPPTPPSKATKPKVKPKEGKKEGETVSPGVDSSPAVASSEEEPLKDSSKDTTGGSPKMTGPPALESTVTPEPMSESAATPKRFSVPPPPRPPPPPPEEGQAEGEDATDGEKAIAKSDEDDSSSTPRDANLLEKSASPTPDPTSDVAPVSTPPRPTPPAKSSKRYSVPPPARPPPLPPVELNEEIKEEDGEGGVTKVEQESHDSSAKPSKPQRPVPELPPPTPVDVPGSDKKAAGADGNEEAGILGGVVVQEPEEIDELDKIADDQGQVRLRLDAEGEEEYDSANDSSGVETLDRYRTALSGNGSPSLPPTPPTKHDSSFPINLTSKWSRNTSAVQSALHSENASASTLALDQDQTQVNTRENAEVYTDAEDGSLEDTTLAHANVHGTDLDDRNDVNDKEMKQDAVEDPMDSRFKFPPAELFPPPPPLPQKRPTNNISANRKAMAFPNDSETSLASAGGAREDESADDADRESTAPRNRKPTKTRAALRTAVLAALGKSSHSPAAGAAAGTAPGEGRRDSSPTISQGEMETESTGTHSSGEDDESNPVTRQMKARLAKLDGLDPLMRPTPFPIGGDGSHGQSQSTPEVPSARRPAAAGLPEDEVRKRQVRLSSKLLPITGPMRMNTSPSSVGAWGKNKMVMSSETVGTIGTIATEPGDLEQSQFGLSIVSESGTQSPPPPSSFITRLKSDASRRPPMRRQTTSTSQASRFVEDLPFVKRSTSPTSMSQSPSQLQSPHQRTATVSFSSRVRTGSMGTVMGPPTRKNSLVPELRAATIEAAERPMSAVSGDFILVEEPEEFDIPRAEWDLPRIPSGSLRLPSTMDLRAKMMQQAQASRLNLDNNANGELNGNGRENIGPSSAPATTSPLSVSVTVAPMMQHSRSATATTGTSGTSGTSNSTNTAKTSASAPASTSRAQAKPISFQVSSGSDGAGPSPGGTMTTTSNGGRLSPDALLDLWGRVGVYISDAAALLHDKSRRVLVGDGTYPGFVLAVSRQVPTSVIPSQTARYPYGHLIYFQTSQTVHKRIAEILPGDIIVLQNALFKGVRGKLGLGAKTYMEEVGTKGDPVVGVIGEFESRKCKVRVYQANQHVGVQTVEYVGYKFEDLKSGTIKIFRVADS